MPGLTRASRHSFYDDPFAATTDHREPALARSSSRFSDSSSDSDTREAIALSLSSSPNGKGKERATPAKRLSRIFHSTSNSFTSTTTVASSSSAGGLSSKATPRKLMQRLNVNFRFGSGSSKAGSSSSAATTGSAERSRRQRVQEDTDRQLALLIQSMDAEGVDYADNLDPDVLQSWLEEGPLDSRSPVEQDADLVGVTEFDCGICLDTCAVDVVCVTQGCRHKICRDCMRSHIMSSLEATKYPIVCAICATDRNNRDASGA